MSEDDLTEKQRAILETNKKNPDMSTEEIAVETDSSASYVSQVLNKYDESDLNDGGNGLAFLVLLLILLGFAYAASSGGGGGETADSLLVLGLLVPKPKI